MNTREIYDRGMINEDYMRSTYSGNYFLNRDRYVNKNNCFAPAGVFKSNDLEDRQIDLDSAMKNMNRVKSKSIISNAPEPLDRFYNQDLRNCDTEFIAPEYSRYLTPARDLRDMENHRFDHPLYDPQCNIPNPSIAMFGIDTRNQAKDNFVTPIPRALRQDTGFPRGYQDPELSFRQNEQIPVSYQNPRVQNYANDYSYLYR